MPLSEQQLVDRDTTDPACNTRLVRSVKESDCTLTDCGSHVQRVLTRSGGKVEKDTVTLDEEKGEITYVDEGHDVEHVTAIPGHPYRYEIYRRNARDKLRAETDTLPRT